MLSVGFDIRPLIFTKAGIRTYLYNLICGLAKTGKCRLSLFVSSKSGIDWSAVSADICEELVRLPHLGRWCERFWEDFLLPGAVRKKNIEVFHGPRFSVPGKLSCTCAVTIHDLAFRKLPGLVLPASAKYFNSLVASSVKAAGKIIVPSDATRADLQELYGVPGEKISVVHEAAESGFRPQADGQKAQALKRKFGIRPNFILSAGTIEPRKNYINLLRAFNLLKIKEDIQLVIAGSRGWLCDDVFAAVKDLGLQDKVVFTGHIDTADLVGLYNTCELFVFPSLYEGFGLPVLEALQSGACVVASNTSSLKELFGGCCYMAEPKSPESIASAIERVLSDKPLRDDLKAKGIARSADFSWAKTADRTIEVYKELTGGAK